MACEQKMGEIVSRDNGQKCNASSVQLILDT